MEPQQTQLQAENQTKNISLPKQKRKNPWKVAMRKLARDKAAMFGLAMLFVISVTVILAPVLPLPDPVEVDLANRLQPIGTEGHLLGTDDLGRDLLSRLIWGGRVSIAVGFIAVGIALVFGTILGLIAGYFQKFFDTVIMRFIDILMAFPYVLLAIAIVAALGPGLMNTMIAVSIVGIPYYARIVRGSALMFRNMEFVVAERALGAGHGHILVHHIIPNCLPPLIVAASLDVGWMILAAAGMSFIGLGAQPPMAEWGVMLSEGQQFIRVAPHLSLLPGAAIFLVVLSLNLLGDGLRDVLDPKSK
ncbi:dipeptide transport system permease protein DppC [Halalkalibacter wakoensis JCM 9140]|uniref:Dipeptide transport system permease protein DppC n=1 Tax=Halalkalibacter wakoensis JCM 9140 TaxID=1236970 RepID=W4Q5U4_9BACI|nr:ABC transporter permease [Halalkalibacter wakoensis]GAE26744.1 dipeptide transport system permease protein DppC [Halalkalibacter wakoensis JCM 9140]